MRTIFLSHKELTKLNDGRSFTTEFVKKIYAYKNTEINHGTLFFDVYDRDYENLEEGLTYPE